MKAIELRNVSYTYPEGTPALNNVSLSIPMGSRTALLGPNGAGKSTLLLHLNGLLQAQSGQVVVLGRQLNGDSQWVKQVVGMVFQDPDDQVFSSTVAEDVAFGPANMGLPPDEISSRVERALKEVGLVGFEERAPPKLSYGEKKRVALAGVLAMDPEILVLDEPMAFLDPLGQRSLKAILNRLAKQGKTLLVATHDVDFAVEWADRVVVLGKGCIRYQGDPKALSDDEIIRETQLVPPTVVRLFRGYERLCGGSIPLTIDEARLCLARIEERMKQT